MLDVGFRLAGFALLRQASRLAVVVPVIFFIFYAGSRAAGPRLQGILSAIETSTNNTALPPSLLWGHGLEWAFRSS